MNTLIFFLIVIVIVFILPLVALLGLLCYVLWYTLNSNSGVQFTVSWQGNPLSPGNCKTRPPIGSTCGSNLITAWRTPAGRGYKVFH